MYTYILISCVFLCMQMRQVQAQEAENIALRTLIAHAQNELREAVLINAMAPPPPAPVTTAPAIATITPAVIASTPDIMSPAPITTTAAAPRQEAKVSMKPRQPTPSAAVTAITADKTSRHVSNNRLKSPPSAAPIKATVTTTASAPANTDDDDDVSLWGAKGPKKEAATKLTAATTTTTASAVLNKVPSEDEWVQWSAPNRGPTNALSQSNKTCASQKGTSTAQAPVAAKTTTVESTTNAASTYVGKTLHVTKPSLKPRSLKPDLPAPRNRNGNKTILILNTIYYMLTVC